jgi:Flp pilus assembly protein TadD
MAWNNRGNGYLQLQQYEKAIEDCTEAIKLGPKLAMAWNNRGNGYLQLQQYEKAIEDWSEAIKLDSKLALAWSLRGFAYFRLHKYEKSIADCSEAIKLDPKLVQAWFFRGRAYDELHDYEKALADCTKAVEVDSKDAWAHCHLGLTLTHMGRLDDALVEYREAIKLKPDYAEAHNNLGCSLLAMGRFEEAVAKFREVIRLNKDDAAAHNNLGEAVKLAEIAKRLQAIRHRTDQPRDAAERIEFAQLCQDYLKQFAAAARFYDEAFAADPKLADDQSGRHRYNAACVAALAGCGKGTDADKLDDKERARLRRQALDWLRANLEAWVQAIGKEPDKVRLFLVQQMRKWLEDTAFAGVRGPEALAKFPEAERQPWRKLWDDVANTLAQAQGTTTLQKKSGAK